MSSLIALIKSWISKIVAFFKRGNTDPGTDRPDPDEMVCYYGCPNSNKARSLQLERKPYKRG